MTGLHAIGWREFRRRRVHYALTGLGIVLGVANVFGVLVSNATTTRHLERSAADIVGEGDVMVVGRAPISEQQVDALRRLPGVEAIAAVSQGALTITGLGEDSATLSVAGLDPRLVRGATIETGRLYASAALEVIVSREAARLLGIELGDALPLSGRESPLRVVGMFSDMGPQAAESTGWADAVTSARTVDGLTGEGFRTVDVFLTRDTEPDVWSATHEHAFPDLTFSHSIVPREFRRSMALVQTTLSGAAGLALFVGAFLIYSTFSMTVVERTRLYGTLHAVGATAKQVRWAVLGEALVLGTSATIVGLLLGLGLALVLLHLVSEPVIAGSSLWITPGALALAVAVGILATLAGALGPARHAGRLSPVEAIRGPAGSDHRPMRAWVVGVLASVGAACLYILDRRSARTDLTALSFAPLLLVLLAAVLVVSPFLPLLARATRRIARRVSPGLGEVAVMHVSRERGRSAYTVGLVLVVLAMVLAVGGVYESIRRITDRWVETRFGADLIVYREDIFPYARTGIEETEGVRRVAPVTYGRVRVVRPSGAGAQALVVIDPATFFDAAGFPWAEGDDASVRAALEHGHSLVLPSSTAHTLGLRRGGTMVLDTRQGLRSFSVAGTYATIASGPEVGVVVGVRDGRRYFGTDKPNVLYVTYAPDADAASVTASVVETLARLEQVPPDIAGERLVGRYQLITGTQIKAAARGELKKYFGAYLAVLLVAAIVGFLGLANTMSRHIIQRYREIGILQAIGAGPQEIRRMVGVEATTLVFAAFALSLPLGYLLTRMIVGRATALLGFGVDYLYPWAWVPVVGILAALIAVSAAVTPAVHAANLTPVEALRHE